MLYITGLSCACTPKKRAISGQAVGGCSRGCGRRQGHTEALCKWWYGKCGAASLPASGIPSQACGLKADRVWRLGELVEQQRGWREKKAQAEVEEVVGRIRQVGAAFSLRPRLLGLCGLRAWPCHAPCGCLRLLQLLCHEELLGGACSPWSSGGHWLLACTGC